MHFKFRGMISPIFYGKERKTIAPTLGSLISMPVRLLFQAQFSRLYAPSARAAGT